MIVTKTYVQVAYVFVEESDLTRAQNAAIEAAEHNQEWASVITKITAEGVHTWDEDSKP